MSRSCSLCDLFRSEYYQIKCQLDPMLICIRTYHICLNANTCQMVSFVCVGKLILSSISNGIIHVSNRSWKKCCSLFLSFHLFQLSEFTWNYATVSNEEWQLTSSSVQHTLHHIPFSVDAVSATLIKTNIHVPINNEKTICTSMLSVILTSQSTDGCKHLLWRWCINAHL